MFRALPTPAKNVFVGAPTYENGDCPTQVIYQRKSQCESNTISTNAPM